MQYKVVVKGQLKGLNELLNGRMYNYRTKSYANSVKASNDAMCIRAIKGQLRGVKLHTPIKCTFYIYCKDMRHDRGNVSSAVEKSFLDALQKSGVLENDSWKCVYDSVFHTYVDRENPRVVVIIDEL